MWSDVAPWVAIAISAAAFVYSMIIGRSNRNNAKFEAINERISTVAERVDLVEDRVTKVESDVEHLPDKDSTHRLEIALGEMKAEMGRLSERMRPIASMADRLQEAMLERAMK
jgi:predicted  nucleic acid-binding Zn-ribbon protein